MTLLSCKTSPTVRFWYLRFLTNLIFLGAFLNPDLAIRSEVLLNNDNRQRDPYFRAWTHKCTTKAASGSWRRYGKGSGAQHKCLQRPVNARLRWTMVSKIHQFRTVQAGMTLSSTPLKNIPTKTCYSITSATLIVFYYLQIWFRSILDSRLNRRRKVKRWATSKNKTKGSKSQERR